MDEARIRAARHAAENKRPSDSAHEPESEKPKERHEMNANSQPRININNRIDSRGRRGEKPGRVKWMIIGAATTVLIIITLVAWWVWTLMGAYVGIDSSKYQAVFFTNGQVYFGKLHTMNGDYMRLTDIFYLQRKAAADDKNLQETAKQSNDVELIKLGEELHGPQDEMVINKDQILFYENLKSDGKVASTIASYKP